MTDDPIRRVRSFNRLVTEQIDALNDHYLSRDRPLGEARVLWEIDLDGCDVRRLRARLGLDSGYRSRMLQSLEAAGLVSVDRHPGDGRVRTAQLTPAGVAEREVLDRRSDELAGSMLEPLSPSARERLVAAMGEVERLVTVGLVKIEAVDAGARHAQHCLQAYFAELGERFDAGFGHAAPLITERHDLNPPAGVFLVATLRSEPVACGGLRFHDGEPPDIKRMWVAASVRGLGIGRRADDELERRAALSGARAVRLETNKALTEAIELYRSAGYREVEAFNAEP
jgi:DNA-binding MarR family transcriptional regulator/ribosomal protein S18 acetylase RimI-like enzyme